MNEWEIFLLSKVSGHQEKTVNQQWHNKNVVWLISLEFYDGGEYKNTTAFQIKNKVFNLNLINTTNTKYTLFL